MLSSVFRRPYYKETLLVFILLSITYGYFYTHGGFNENSRLALTFAMIDKGTISLDAEDVTNRDSPLYTEDLSAKNGRLYTDKAPGSSFIAALAYFPIHQIEKVFGVTLDVRSKMHLLVFLVLGLTSALAGSLIFRLSLYLSKSVCKAFLVTAAIALGTICFPFSTSFFGHQLAGSYLFISFFLIFLISTQKQELLVSHLYTFIIGLLLGLSIQTEYMTAIVVVPLIVYYFIKIWQEKELRRISNIVWPFLGGLLPILVNLIYNQIAFGGILNIGYQYLVDAGFRQSMSSGFMGIGRPNLHVIFFQTFHPTLGIFWLSPVLLMSIVGGICMLRDKHYRLELFLAFFSCAVYIIVNSGYYMWWGGNSLGPRAIIPMLPFMSIPLIFVPKKWNPVMLVLIFISVFQMFFASASIFLVPAEKIGLIKKAPFFYDSYLYDHCWQLLKNGKFTWNIGQNWLGLQGWVSLIPLLVTWVILIALLFYKPESNSKRNSKGQIYD